MEPDDAADFVGLAPEERRDEILAALSKEATRKVEQLLNYPKDVAGGIMSTDSIVFEESVTAREAIQSLRESPPRRIFYNIYVLNKDGILLGWCTWQQLLLADPETHLAELIPASCPSVDALTPQEEVAQLVAKYDIAAIPVVDIDGRLVGTITNDDIIDVIAEEASEDMMRMAGGSEEELHQPAVIKSFGSRIPWLVSTFSVGCITTILLATQKNVMSQIVAVSFYIPITMAFGGNVGLQTATMTIRRIVLGETGIRGLLSDLWREIRVGMLLGATFGMLMGTIAGFIMPEADPRLGLVVGLAMLSAASAAAMVGTLIPIVFQKLSVDPSVAGSPIVAALDDLSAIGIYFTLIHFML